MKYNQKEKLKQITPNTLVVGINIEKKKHAARAIDDRGWKAIDLGKQHSGL